MKTRAQKAREVNDDQPSFDVKAGKLIRRGPRKNLRIGLATLRGAQELTQKDVAERAGIDQGEVSRLEARGDCLVSTLERYAKAIGGSLKLVVEIDGRPYMIGLGR